MRTDIDHIIRAGTMAPSGDNCQPWRFTVSGNSIDVDLIPERDESLYSWGHRASFIAHGAMLENMEIEAHARGYHLTVSELPDSTRPLRTAHIDVTQTQSTPSPLADAIAHRCTNRKPYRNTPLSDAQRNAIRTALGDDALLIEDAPTKQKLAAAVAWNEKVLFENKHMHRFFFDHMLWTQRDVAARPIGFPVAALELPPPVRMLWPSFRHWPVMATLTSVGFARGIVFGNTPIYASGAAMACFTMRDRSEKEFIRAGRLLQRTWLTATHLGLSAQILTGVPLLMNRIEGGAQDLTDAHAALVRRQYERIREAVGTKSVVAFLLRIGDGGEPSARTPRLSTVTT